MYDLEMSTQSLVYIRAHRPLSQKNNVNYLVHSNKIGQSISGNPWKEVNGALFYDNKP